MEAISVLSYTLLGGVAVGGALYTIGADLLAAHGRGTVRCGSRARQAVGLAFRRELERTLQRLARLVVEEPRYRRLEAFRCTTLFWRVATRLGFEVCARAIAWHQRFLGWYQRRLLVGDHPLGIRRLQGRRWEARPL